MKKLMIALAIATIAVCSHAATTKWGLGSSKASFNGTALGAYAVQLYIVGVNDAADALYDTRNTMSGAGAGRMTAGIGSQSAVYTDTVAGGPMTIDGVDAGREFYIKLIYTDGGKNYEYISSAVASTGLSSKSQGSVTFTFNDRIIESGTDGWVAQSVPEPTSGLLLLLGVAGIALKRRRA